MKPPARCVHMVVVALAIFATACSGGSSNPTADRVTAPLAPPTAGSELAWTPCGHLSCATINLPVDYNDPTGPKLAIAVAIARTKATGDSYKGVLFINPGGPGVSAIDFIDWFITGGFPDALANHFDIVGIDPRGVGASEPTFRCGADGEQLAITNSIDGDVDTPDELDAAEHSARLCIESMGAAGGLLHTDYVARDMDAVREALGAEQLNFLGFSYGSMIGTWYASLFPERVRSMVLDGAGNPIDASATSAQRVDNDVEEIRQFETLLSDALAACTNSNCPMYNDGDPVGYFFDAVTKLHLVNQEMANNPLAGALAVISGLYSESDWPVLWGALADLSEHDDPSRLVSLANFQFGGQEAQASITAHINCLDDWVIESHVSRKERIADGEALTARTEIQFPLLSALDIISFDPCPYYDQFAPPSLAGPLDGGGVPIVVIGNRSDPATPFAESEELAMGTLSNGILIETTHFRHTVYPLNDCVNSVVEAALIDNVVPATRRVICPEA